MCEKPGPQLTAHDQLLYRQVRNDWFQEDGDPSSMAFKPLRPEDEMCLSVDRDGLTDAEGAFRLYTTPKPGGFSGQSSGVWGITVKDVSDAGVTAWEDPVAKTEAFPANPAHAVVEFAGLSNNKRDNAARLMKARAIKRGRLYPALEASATISPQG